MMDTIYREQAIDAIEKLIFPQTKGETAAEDINSIAWRCAINCAEEMIGHLPPAEKTGKWIEHDDDWFGYYYECSVCGAAFTLIDGTPADNLYNYCPNCGARMEVD